jgi:NAD/NADP transhydrogenase alpha subunit
MPITIGVLREVTPGETRVALVPEVAGKFRAAGAVTVERGRVQAQFADSLWKDVEFTATAAGCAAADVLIRVRRRPSRSRAPEAGAVS